MKKSLVDGVMTAPGRARISVDTPDLSVSYRDTDDAAWIRSSPGTVSRALRSFVPLANHVVKERRDLGIGGLLLSCPASPTLPIDAEHLVRADFGPLGKVHLHARAAHEKKSSEDLGHLGVVPDDPGPLQSG
jgi:hypothetical protein